MSLFERIAAVVFLAMVLAALVGMVWWRQWAENLDSRLAERRTRKANEAAMAAWLAHDGPQLIPPLSYAEREQIYQEFIDKAAHHGGDGHA